MPHLTNRQRDIVHMLSSRGETAFRYTPGNRAALVVLVARDLVRWTREDTAGRQWYQLTDEGERVAKGILRVAVEVPS
jgi:hypothetical protein